MLTRHHCGKRISEAVISRHLGQRGGKVTAKLGSEHFSKLAKMRKSHKGGRPKKKAE